MRRLFIIAIPIALLGIVYAMGPNPSTPNYNIDLPAVPAGNIALEAYVATGEAAHTIKPGNQATIVWNDSLHQKTRYAIVYLHGFSASHEEGNPIHLAIAKKFGCNLYLSRLSQHGIDTADALVSMTAENLWESAKEAYAIGSQLGDSVILMGTSTGGSLALQLAATYHTNIAALVLMSPNIAINDANAWLLNNPWGLQIAHLVKASDLNTAANDTKLYKQYWNKQYRLEAAVQLQEYVETIMTGQTFEKVTQPIATLYYYKDEQHQDPVVKVSAIQQMMKEVSTPAGLKKEQAIPGVENHVMGSYILSKDLPAVENAITTFLQQVVFTR